MPRLNIALPLVARVTRPLVSDLLVSNSASIHSLNALAGMRGFARDRRSLLLPSWFALCPPSFSIPEFLLKLRGELLKRPPQVQNLHLKMPRPKLRPENRRSLALKSVTFEGDKPKNVQ